MRSSICFRWVRTPQWRCLRPTRQRWPSCGIRGAPMPRSSASVHHERNTVLANFVLSSQSILGSVWTLKLSVFQQLRRRWPVSPNLFPPSLTHRCFPYFSPFHNSNALGTEVLLKPWDGWQAYAFPPYVLIPAIL